MVNNKVAMAASRVVITNVRATVVNNKAVTVANSRAVMDNPMAATTTTTATTRPQPTADTLVSYRRNPQ